MRAIFISYRRQDTEGQAGRLFKDLVQRFGPGSVFMDVVDIEPGRDYRRVIDQQVASCGVLLAVMGRHWAATGPTRSMRPGAGASTSRPTRCGWRRPPRCAATSR